MKIKKKRFLLEFVDFQEQEKLNFVNNYYFK
jgi:hypothetical protein